MEIPRHWRLRQQRYRLVGEICPHCSDKIFPPRDICPSCSGEVSIKHTMSGKGTIYSFSTIYEPPEGFSAQAPYHVALIKLEDGPLITAQLTDYEGIAPKINQPVEMVTRKLAEQGDTGLITYGYKFRPPITQSK